jgi:hypothetical protein
MYFYDRRANTTVTYMKLRSGDWGLRGYNLKEHSTVQVKKKDGTSKTETVGKVVWRGDDGLTFAAIGKGHSPNESGGGGHSYDRRAPRGKYECEECGEYVTPGTRCWETGMMH